MKFKGNKETRRAVLLTAAGILAGAGLLYADLRAARLEEGYLLERPEDGGETLEETLQVQAGDWRFPMEVSVTGKSPGREEIRRQLEEMERRLPEMILGENPSLDEVRKPLELIQETEGSPITVSWDVEYGGAVNADGSLNQEDLDEKGAAAELTACLQWEEETVLSTFFVHVYPPQLTEEEKLLQAVREAVGQAAEDSQYGERQALPREAEGVPLKWKRRPDLRGFLVMLAAVAGAVLQTGAKRREEEKRLEKRRVQMEMDYPEVVSKLKLYMETGLTCRAAWMKIAKDYQEKQKKSERESRYAYEEMVRTGFEMQSGVSERQAYERFADRCQLSCYKKLTGLLLQNLRKGNRGLGELLEAEMWQAFDARKALAKKQGEEAGTKLLLPMIGMLAIVMVIVMAPALMSMQM